jgi:hypothetical protein
MQHPRYAALVLRQTLALLVDAHPPGAAWRKAEKARRQHLGLAYLGRESTSFFFDVEVV